ncbi:MAG: hypothetical protein IJM90_09520 [Firmicutes bacterium]|nr:hypothetical protein [Bacillota bacterium]
MKKEFLKQTEHSVTLNVTAGKIDSFRELEKTTGTVRVYDNGCIGVAGCLGEPDEEELTAKAVEALAFGIPYPCRLDGHLVLEDLHEEEIIKVPDFIPMMTAFLDRLCEMCPKFAFSNKINLSYNRSEYRNSEGRHLVSSGRLFSIELIAQNRGSGNLFDTFLVWQGNHFDEETVLSNFKKHYDAFYTPVELEPGRYPVIADVSGLFGSFFPHFIGDMYVSGASLLSGKLGQKIFSDKLSLRDDMNPSSAYIVSFFDAEGYTVPDYRPTLIENGVLKGLFTTKKTATQYGLPDLGTASAAYDGVPGIGFHRFWLDPTAKSLKELVPGKAVYVVVASGGDATPDGHFATPVQMAFLMEDGQPVGRLPALTVSGDFGDMFGADYIGAVHNDPQENDILGAVYMDVEKD